MAGRLKTGNQQVRQPQGGVTRFAFWALLATLVVAWVYGVYLPDRHKLVEARALRASLLEEVSELSTEVNSMTMSEQLLAADAPYMWEQFRRIRLNWTAPGEHRIDRNSQDQ